MLHFVLFKWQQFKFRETYTDQHVNIVAGMLRRNVLKHPFKIHCVTDQPYGIDGKVIVHDLWRDHDDLPNVTGQHLPSCYRRLKLFDRETQTSLGIATGERIVSIDLDSIILQPLDDVFDRIEGTQCNFAGWGVRGTFHQTVYNGSFWSFKAGNHLQHIWSGFDPKTSPRKALTSGFLGSDQGWLSMNFARDPNTCPIRFPDFASYPREVKRTAVLDRRTKVVFFHGSRKPWHAEEMKRQPWIIRAWRENP